MSDNNPNDEESKSIIDNLQQANKLIRSRALLLAFFLVLMMSFSLSIDQNKNELKQIYKTYDKLLAIMKPDSMKKILIHDSLKYFYNTNLGEYMSLEVLYDKLVRDSFKNKEPLYNTIDLLDEVLRGKIKEQKEATISMAGFAIPITPIMILAPIILLILYHDFAMIMIYRKNLEEKVLKLKIDYWKTGPEVVGLYMFDFIPYRFRHMKWLWGIIQMVILFLPMIQVCYFSFYGVSESKQVGIAVPIIDFVCCIFIFSNFLMLIDYENLLNIRDISMVFVGKINADAIEGKTYNRQRLFFVVPIFMLFFTSLSFWGFSNLDYKESILCGIVSLGQGILLSLFSWLRSHPRFQKRKTGFRILAGGCFFATFFWFIIDLLACLGVVRFRELSPENYITFSFILFIIGLYFKAIYVSYAGRSIRRAEAGR
jgi:hypothetical protein